MISYLTKTLFLMLIFIFGCSINNLIMSIFSFCAAKCKAVASLKILTWTVLNQNE